MHAIYTHTHILSLKLNKQGKERIKKAKHFNKMIHLIETLYNNGSCIYRCLNFDEGCLQMYILQNVYFDEGTLHPYRQSSIKPFSLVSQCEWLHAMNALPAFHLHLYDFLKYITQISSH